MFNEKINFRISTGYTMELNVMVGAYGAMSMPNS